MSGYGTFEKCSGGIAEVRKERGSGHNQCGLVRRMGFMEWGLLSEGAETFKKSDLKRSFKRLITATLVFVSLRSRFTGGPLGSRRQILCNRFSNPSTQVKTTGTTKRLSAVELNRPPMNPRRGPCARLRRTFRQFQAAACDPHLYFKPAEFKIQGKSA